MPSKNTILTFGVRKNVNKNNLFGNFMFFVFSGGGGESRRTAAIFVSRSVCSENGAALDRQLQSSLHTSPLGPSRRALSRLDRRRENRRTSCAVSLKQWPGAGGLVVRGMNGANEEEKKKFRTRKLKKKV